MTESKVDVLGVLAREAEQHMNSLPEFQPELDEVLAAQAAVAELIAAVKALSDFYERTDVDDNSKRFWALNDAAWSRVDAALAACTPAKSEGG